jgi:predicted DsbA family dithiol-disulfide isomerase
VGDPGAGGNTTRAEVVERYMIIEVWSDIVCPWCAIGRARLDAALADFRHASEVEVVLRSFQLDPAAPVVSDGSAEPMVDVLARRYGVGRAEAAGMMKRVEGIAGAEGLVMHMETTRHSNTVDAHRLLHLAGATGGGELQKRLNSDLMTAYFEHGEDVSDHDVLRRIALAAGLDAGEVDEVLAGERYADAIAADVGQAHAYGATGVPFFVVDRRYGVSGAQPVEIFAQVLERAWADALSA